MKTKTPDNSRLTFVPVHREVPIALVGQLAVVHAALEQVHVVLPAGRPGGQYPRSVLLQQPLGAFVVDLVDRRLTLELKV